MACARNGPNPFLIPTALLGGSFNPAHLGHRRISLSAARMLNAKEVWWLVSPGNPLKKKAQDMAPLKARLHSANLRAKKSIIRPTAIEREFQTQFTIDTLKKLVRRYPNRRFIWLMGADNLAQFHRWRDWRGIASLVAIAVIERPGYSRRAPARRAMGWLRKFVRPANQVNCWTKWRPPALVHLRFSPDKSSATAVRRANPGWIRISIPNRLRDPLTRNQVD